MRNRGGDDRPGPATSGAQEHGIVAAIAAVATMQDGWNPIAPGWSPLVVVVGWALLTMRFFRWE